MSDYTPPMERLRDEYVGMRAKHYGFSDLYAEEWDRAIAAERQAVRKQIAHELEKAQQRLEHRNAQRQNDKQRIESNEKVRKQATEKAAKLERRVSWLTERNQQREDQADRLYARAMEAEAERDRLAAQVQAVRGLATAWETHPDLDGHPIAQEVADGLVAQLRAALGEG